MSKKRIIAIITIIVLLFAAGISVGVFLYGRAETQATDGTQASDQNQDPNEKQDIQGTLAEGDIQNNDNNADGEENTTTSAEGNGDEAENNETVENDNQNANNEATNNNNVAENTNNEGVTTDNNVENVGETTITRVEEQERLISEDFLDWWQPMTVSVKPTEVGVQLPKISVKKAVITGVSGDQLIYIGQDITYVIAVTNNSETAVENIEITDKIPENTTYVTDSIEEPVILRKIEGELTSEVVGTKSIVEVENKVVGVKWVVSIPAGETVIARFTVNVNKTMVNEKQEEVETIGTIRNTAIANGEESNEVQTSIIRTHKSSEITRLNEENQQYEVVETAKIGDLIKYTISIENTGDVEGTTYVIDEVPEGTAFISAQEGAKVTKSIDTSIIWSVTIPAHTTITREFTVEVTSVEGLIKNVADVGGTPTNEDIIDTANIDVIKTATAVKRVGENEFTTPVGEVREGDIIQYTIVVTNTGSRDLTNVLLEEQLDRVEVTKLVVDGIEKDIVKDEETEKLIIGDLKAAKEATEETEAVEVGVAVITATYTVSYSSEMNTGNEGYKDGTLEFIYNKVRATGETIPKTPEEVPEEVEDDDDETVPVIPDPNFIVEKTAINVKRVGESEFVDIIGKVRPGDVVKYEIVITNIGNTKLTNIEVRDTLDVRVDEYDETEEPITAGNIIKVIPSLVSGAHTTITTYYEVNQDDIIFGKVNEEDLIEIEVIENIVTAKPEELEEKDDNEIVPVNPNTKVEGTKTWDDNKNQDGKRPSSITIRLLADGKEVQNKVVTANDNWSWKFENLPVYENGKKLEYTITEDAVAEYTTNVDGFNVTNTHVPETTKLEGTKTWVDNNNQDGKRPSSITIRLLADGKEVQNRVVTANDNWSWKFENLPVYENGKKLEYTITEDAVTAYTPEVNGYNVTNTILQQNTVDISGTKTWYVPDRYNVPNITIRLYQNGKPFKKANGEDLIFVIQNGAETYQFNGLPKYKIENGKYIIDANGNFEENVYTVSEDPIPGFKCEQKDFDFINTRQEKTSISGTKTWDDNKNQDGKRPSTITINLWADGVKLNNKPEISKAQDAQGKWTYTFKDLEKYSNLGKEIKYTVTEETVLGYEKPQINGYDITNKHTPETTTIQGTKTWNDGNNKYGKRPTSITVNLLANGTKVESKTINPDAKGNWPAYKFENKPVYSNGKKISYTITEDAVAGYTATPNGYNLTNTYNEPTGTITRNWDITSTTAAPIPVDVVFVLDTSYSMIQGTGNTRGEDLVKAVNSSIGEILSFNSYNRVSVVGFSEDGMYGDGHNNLTDASVLLSLGRYNVKDTNNKKSYLVKDGDKVYTNVKKENGDSYSTKTRYFEQGTYTQAGIKLGAQQLLGVSKTDTTVKINDKTTVKRIPMIILVSDGEPTAFTTTFNNPEINVETYKNKDVTKYNSKKLGTGQLKNNSAIYGYYTILTANYYKKEVGSHYNTIAKMFTIAMDLTTYYGETVLNPGKDEVNACATHVEVNEKNGLKNQIENKNIAQDLYKYLKTTKNTKVTFKEIEKDSKGNVKSNDNGLIYKNTTITINYKNESQYRGDYADKAFKGKMSATDLKNAMIGSITETTADSKEWKLSEITAEEKANCRANLPNIDTKGAFTLLVKVGTKTVMNYKDFNSALTGPEKVINGNATSGYYLDLKAIPAGATVTVTYRQK